MTAMWLAAMAMLLLALAFVLPALMRRRWVAGAAAIVLPLAAVGLYLQVGDPLAAAALSGAQHPDADGVEIEAMVGRLAARLQAQPDDLAGWVMLARSYEVLGRLDDAVLAWERALALAPDDPDLRAQLGRLRPAPAPSPAP